MILDLNGRSSSRMGASWILCISAGQSNIVCTATPNGCVTATRICACVPFKWASAVGDPDRGEAECLPVAS
ncbi:hypothetical protein BU24DRAFT_64102 [Aaosphaeria arxii CBS 175.79]|uniref:Uncharacterized protein n=1 Tax=Aaosphaeria arxii CBS 175.79 TaxID=1450172 RepID=A0A6A5XAJ9_9PLEO|nr:uncharacterized protein BU24DRAFT_64102 [Aaosphaeria arxii CBS 175.79]KAF2009794.1 hypothetical protein BU24DRAFT_64102 [Aaosphaeria arxii CBS 175.79]